MSFFDSLIRLGYSSDLHQQLKGLAPDCSGTTGNALYQLTGIVLLGVSLAVMLNYYYGLFNNPRFTHRRVWLVNILMAGSMVGLFAYVNTARFLPLEKHCEELHFTALDCGLFAFTAMIYTVIVCMLLSVFLKWRSVANKKIPF